MISIIAALADNRAIGKENKMLWHLSEDLKYFKKVTSGHPVIMGRNTFLSIGSKPLPNRRNIVVSRRMKQGTHDGIEVFPSLEAALQYAQVSGDEVFVMGGGMLYRSALPLADRLYLTEVETSIADADTFFPEIDLNVWKEISRSKKLHDDRTGYDFSFVILEK